MTNKISTKRPSDSKKCFREIVTIIDNMELAADSGFSIGYEARTLLSLIELYGDRRAIEAKVSMGYLPDEDEV